MRDEWSKNLTDGRTVIYTSDITRGTGGVITRKVGDMIQTIQVNTPISQPSAEWAPTHAADFQNSVAGTGRRSNPAGQRRSGKGPPQKKPPIYDSGEGDYSEKP
jgi:hypothetical protein